MNKSKKTPTKSKTRNVYTLETKANGLRYYLLGLTLNEISKLIDAPVRTVEKWYITENWKKARELKPVHLKALELYESGKSYKAVAKTLNKSLPTIGRYIKLARNEKSND